MHQEQVKILIKIYFIYLEHFWNWKNFCVSQTENAGTFHSKLIIEHGENIQSTPHISSFSTDSNAPRHRIHQTFDYQMKCFNGLAPKQTWKCLIDLTLWLNVCIAFLLIKDYCSFTSWPARRNIAFQEWLLFQKHAKSIQKSTLIYQHFL